MLRTTRPSAARISSAAGDRRQRTRMQAADRRTSTSAAKQVLVIYCPRSRQSRRYIRLQTGAVSKLHGQKPPGHPCRDLRRPNRQHRETVLGLQATWSNPARWCPIYYRIWREQVDDFCFLHSLTTDTSAHPQGENFMNTGFTMEGFPSFGAWVTYALGTENRKSCQRSLPSMILAWLGSQRQEQLWQRIPSCGFSRNRLSMRNQSAQQPRAASTEVSVSR